MLKRFRHDDMDVWFLYGQHLLETGRSDKARELLQKAISSLPMKHHVMVLSRFAQLEYKYGDAERGKTMFEKILHTYTKKTDVWSVYVDMVLKHEGIDEARKVFERAVTCGMNAHKARTLFKKWMDAEEKYGDEETLKMVKRRALGHAEVKEER
ncbi:S1 RNA binding domain containing protein [Aphelenchoides avenae]|nr:S1 RNA binding domain containing protein [Aphelenchus avenae]